MTFTLQSRKFILEYSNNFYLPPRYDGKIKSYDSCTDLRAWSLHEDERSDYLIDLIRAETPPHDRLVPYNIMVSILSAIKEGVLKSLFKSLNLPYLQDDDPPHDKVEFVEEISTEAELELLYPDLLWSHQTENSSPFTTARSVENGVQIIIPHKEKEEELQKVIMSKDEAIELLNNKLNEMKLLLEKKNSLSDNLKQPNGLEPKNINQHSVPDEGNIHLTELRNEIALLNDEKNMLSIKNTEMNKEIQEFKSNLDNIDDLKNQLSYYLDHIQNSIDNQDANHMKVHMSLEKVLKIDEAKAKIITSDLKKKQQEFEKEIQSQLAEAVHMYQQAQNDLQEKNNELVALSCKLQEIKMERDKLIQSSNKNKPIAEAHITKCESMELTDNPIITSTSSFRKRDKKSDKAVPKLKTVSKFILVSDDSPKKLKRPTRLPLYNTKAVLSKNAISKEKSPEPSEKDELDLRYSNFNIDMSMQTDDLIVLSKCLSKEIINSQTAIPTEPNICSGNIDSINIIHEVPERCAEKQVHQMNQLRQTLSTNLILLEDRNEISLSDSSKLINTQNLENTSLKTAVDDINEITNWYSNNIEKMILPQPSLGGSKNMKLLARTKNIQNIQNFDTSQPIDKTAENLGPYSYAQLLRNKYTKSRRVTLEAQSCKVQNTSDILKKTFPTTRLKVLRKQIHTVLNHDIANTLNHIHLFQHSRHIQEPSYRNVRVIKGGAPLRIEELNKYYPQLQVHPENCFHQTPNDSNTTIKGTNINVKFLNYSMHIRINNND